MTSLFGPTSCDVQHAYIHYFYFAASSVFLRAPTINFVFADICIIIQFISADNGSFLLHELVKGNGNVRPRTGMRSHRGRLGTALIFYLGARLSPRAGLEGCGKSHPHRHSIPKPSSPQRVAIPTELSRKTFQRTKRSEMQ